MPLAESAPRRSVSYLLIACVAAGVLLYTLGHTALLRNSPTSSIFPQLDGDVEKPFVLRLLIPMVCRIMAMVTPDVIQDGVTDAMKALAGLPSDLFQWTGWRDFSPLVYQPPYAFEVFVAVLLLYASLLAYGIALYRVSVAAFPQCWHVPLLTALLSFAMLLPLAHGRYKLYDAPTLAFSALCLLFMYKERWAAYMAAFTLGCLNKESIILQTGVFAAAFFGTMPQRKFVALLALQCLIWAALKLAIDSIYAGNDGPLVIFRGWFVISTTIRSIGIKDLIILAALAAMLFAHWREIPRVLRQALWLLPGCGLIYCLFGYPLEYRVFFEAFPVVAVIAGYTLFTPLERIGQWLNA